MKLQYIINFNWRMKLQEIKTYIITLRMKKAKSNVQGLKWYMTKNSCADIIKRRQEREKGGEILSDNWHVSGHLGLTRAAPWEREYVWKLF